MCQKNRVWQDAAYFADPVRRKNISIALKKKWSTEAGRESRERVGQINSVKMKQFNQTPAGIENRKRASINNSLMMKQKIRDGEFIPNITNSWTHWSAVIHIGTDTRKFRSSWEACFWFSNQHLEYENIRIPYYDLENELHTYIGDFYDSKNNILYELKPRCQFIKNNHKLQQIIEYCISNSIKFIWINEDNILDYIDQSIFEDENKLQLNKLLHGIKKNKDIID